MFIEANGMEISLFIYFSYSLDLKKGGNWNFFLLEINFLWD